MIKQIFKLLFFIATLSSLLACNKIGIQYKDTEIAMADEKSCGFLQNSVGQRVTWAGRLPIQFSIDSSVPAEYRVALTTAADDWNKIFGKNLITISSEIVTSPQWAVDGKNIIYWVTKTGVFTDSNQQAKSLVRWVGNQISDVDILINAVDWHFYVTDTEDKSALHLESLLVHELGHSLGLVHQPSYKSVMYMSLADNVVRDVPTQDPDLSNLGCVY